MTYADYAAVTAAYLLLTTPAGRSIGLTIEYVGRNAFPTGNALPADEGTKRMGF